MNNADLEKLFYEVLDEIPATAKESIFYYCQTNQVAFGAEFSDAKLDSAERHCGRGLPSAATIPLPKEWHVLFRSYLTSAPVPVIKTLLQHEIIHALLSPHFFPEPGFEPPLQIDFSQITAHSAEILAIVADTTKTKESIYDREEALVIKVNHEWGANEAKAHQWIDRYKPKGRWL